LKLAGHLVKNVAAHWTFFWPPCEDNGSYKTLDTVKHAKLFITRWHALFPLSTAITLLIVVLVQV
jgi:hypothetical protein